MSESPVEPGTKETLGGTLRAKQSAQARPGATYRLQFHSEFTFADAAKIVPYLHELGITDCYASPFLKARPGSRHGYDITDHSRLNPEIGGEADYAAFTGELRRHGMGQILDIVPNHMAVLGNDNRWWNDVLENGPASPFANFFDIDWTASTRPELQGRVLVPVLGDAYGKVLEAGQMRLEFAAGEFAITYFEHRFPVTPGSYGLILGHRADDLQQALSADSPAHLEFQSILTALKNLPPRTETNADKLLERQREKEVIKRRLSALSAENGAVRTFIEQNVAAINGQPGDPRSFDLMEKLLDEQSYRLANWRVAADEINYRRFFDVNELAALSMERPDVFAATHELILRLLREGIVTGLRIDHPDGLFDPKQYLERLQTECQSGSIDPDQNVAANKRRLYVVVEKILTGDETVPDDWPTDGTTGYDFLNAVNGLFVDSVNASSFTRLYRDWIGDDTPYLEWVYRKKLLILQIALSSELQMLSNQLDRLAQGKRWSRDFTRLSLRRALREVIACFPVYRSYVTGIDIREADRRNILRAIRRATARNPALSAALLNFIRDTLLLQPSHAEPVEPDYEAEQLRFVGKFQQVTSPVMAKGAEDTAFYVYNRLLSLNEVGGDPETFGVSPATLHKAFEERQTRWPGAMSATATHDTKRSEDVRARLNVLSEIPAAWLACLTRWRRLNERHKVELEDGNAPDANEEYMLYQTLLGAWPFEPCGDDEYARFVERIQAYMVKALHEAKVHSSWINPNTAYDNAVCEFVGRILSPAANNEFLSDMRGMRKRLAGFGMLNSLGQTLLKITAPGVPDIYQGTELWDFSLVDPDNRRPVDYERRRDMLKTLAGRVQAAGADLRELARELTAQKEDGRIKLFLTWRTLNLRKTLVGLFSSGAYVTLPSYGAKAENIFAFLRQSESDSVLVAVPRMLISLLGEADAILHPEVWGDTILTVPSVPGRRWRNVLTGETHVPQVRDGRHTLPLARLMAHFPVCLLRTDPSI